MADKPADRGKSQPSLELPSLFRRRNKDRPSRARSKPEPEPATGPEPAAAPEPVPQPVPDPVTAEAPADVREPESPQPVPPSVPPVPPEPVPPEPADDPVQTADTQQLPAEEPAAAEPVDEEPVDEEPAAIEAATAAEQRPAGARRSERKARKVRNAELKAERKAERKAARKARRQRLRPTVPPRVAAVATGALIGLLGAGLTWASLVGCDAWRGTRSCGGPGLLVLFVILLVMVIAGALLLRLCRVPEARSTSFLAVGLTAVVVLVSLMQELFSTWMFVAAPLISAATYGIAQWVTTRYVELPEDGPTHDVR